MMEINFINMNANPNPKKSEDIEYIYKFDAANQMAVLQATKFIRDADKFHFNTLTGIGGLCSGQRPGRGLYQYHR